VTACPSRPTQQSRSQRPTRSLLWECGRQLADTRLSCPFAGRLARRLTPPDARQVRTRARRGPARPPRSAPPRRAGFWHPSGFDARPDSLRTWWSRRVKEESARVAELEHDQRDRLSTSVELAGLRQSVRTQNRMVFLTIALLLFAFATIALGILQLKKRQMGARRPVPRRPARRRERVARSHPTGSRLGEMSESGKCGRRRCHLPAPCGRELHCGRELGHDDPGILPVRP
jgi:hypothetical protein